MYIYMYLLIYIYIYMYMNVCIYIYVWHTEQMQKKKNNYLRSQASRRAQNATSSTPLRGQLSQILVSLSGF